MSKYFNIFIGLVTSIVAVSCNDYLDELPDNRTQLNSPGAISSLLVNAYPKGSYIGMCEVMSDNAGDKGSASRVSTPANEDAYFFAENYQSKSQGSPDFYWAMAYQAIAHSNQALDAIEKLTGYDLDAQKGEALVTRAYSHFMLVNLFAKPYNNTTASTDLGIPYVKEIEDELIKEYKRNTVKEVYDLIENDLTEGLKLLDDQVYEVPKYHFTKNAANAFAARFYLYRGASITDYEKSVQHANFVLGANATEMLREWNGFYSNSSYAEIEAQYTKANEKANLLLCEQVDRWGLFYKLQRFSLSMKTRAEIFNKGVLKNNFEYAYTVYGSNKYLNLAKFNLYEIIEDPSSNSVVYSYMAPLFTTDELLFNRIEANIELEQYDLALNDINAFLSTRLKNYDPATDIIDSNDINNQYQQKNQKGSYLQLCLDLKRMDTVHEGLRWFDIRRHDIPVVHETEEGKVYELKAIDTKKVLQIPESARTYGITPNQY